MVHLSRAIEHLHAPEKAFMIEHEDVFLTRIYLKNIYIYTYKIGEFSNN